MHVVARRSVTQLRGLVCIFSVSSLLLLVVVLVGSLLLYSTRDGFTACLHVCVAAVKTIQINDGKKKQQQQFFSVAAKNYKTSVSCWGLSGDFLLSEKTRVVVRTGLYCASICNHYDKKTLLSLIKSV